MTKLERMIKNIESQIDDDFMLSEEAKNMIVQIILEKQCAKMLIQDLIDNRK
jgi:hypothetical protein